LAGAAVVDTTAAPVPARTDVAAVVGGNGGEDDGDKEHRDDHDDDDDDDDDAVHADELGSSWASSGCWLATAPAAAPIVSPWAR